MLSPGRRVANHHKGEEPAAGYALVDALVALLILSTTIILSLKALQVARSAADQAWEVRRADALMAYLAEAPMGGEAMRNGASDGFRWTVETDVTGAERPVEVCRRVVLAESAATRRRFRISTLESCAPGAAA